jgi:hypothetical protein
MEIPPYETLVTLAREVDPFAMAEHLQALGSPREVAEAYDQLLRDAYWSHKDIAMVVALATAGIYYCFAHARLAADDAARRDFKSTAKVLAYNLGSFTWPGWDEPGVTICAMDQRRGLEGARLNLRLAVELQKPFEKICGGAWLLGAHLLAVGELEEALFYFHYSVPETDHAEYGLYQGYVLLGEMVAGREGAYERLETHLDELTRMGGEAAIFARDQLRTARRVFGKPRN